MTHTFFEKNSNFEVEEQFDFDQFIVEISFADDHTQLELVFDPSEDFYQELVENIENGTQRHMICKVAVYYDNREMATEYVSSIVAESPKAWLDAEGGLEADRMVADATSRAHREAVRQLETLKEDFQGA
jgi:hypothetical protein